MSYLTVGAAALNLTPLAWDANARVIRDAIDEARDRGVSILCLPELCITGYGCEDAFLSPGVAKTALEVLQELLPATEGMIVSLGLPVHHRGAIFNTACLVVDGTIAGFTAKQHLAGSGIHYEPRWFKPWPEGHVDALAVGDTRYPLGDLHYRVGDVSIGFEICEDAWVAKRPGADLAERGVDIILNPSASHFAFGKQDVRERFILEGARAFFVSYVYANLLGNEAGRAIYDGGPLIATAGKVVGRAPRFSFAPFQLATAVVDVEHTRMLRAASASFDVNLDAARDASVEVPFAFPKVGPREVDPPLAAWETSPRRKEEELARAVPLALFDYLRKSRSRGFVVSLSGGADSSAVACLVALMVSHVVRDVGLEGLQEALAYIAGIDEASTEAAVVARLLTCAYQATVNSSDTTREAARAVAEAVGATFYELEVDDLVAGYVGMIEGAVGRALSWETDDVTLQNIQARVRGPSVWMLANMANALLLATSNRSEAAVGYATMDGDTCGGLSPIAGIDKAFLRQWLVWLETEGPHGVGPLPALSHVNVQAPTAELRPQEAAQTDEKDLMPYPLLDYIERAAIRDKKLPAEVLELVLARWGDEYDEATAKRYVERFFRLWCRNQWKRERYAPSFHLDDENLDPKTWCRFPILSGGFERELARLGAE